VDRPGHPPEVLNTPVEPHLKLGRGRVPLGLETMLRIHFLQHWFGLSDPAAGDAIDDSDPVRGFVGIEFGGDRDPDDSAFLRFRHLIEEHDLATSILGKVGALPDENGLPLKQGTFGYAKTLSASSAAKVRSGFRDPEMQHTKTGNVWFFGAMVHVRTDAQGLLCRIATGVAQGDIPRLPELIHYRKRELNGDGELWRDNQCRSFREIGIRYRVNRRGHRTKPPSGSRKRLNHNRSRIRSMGEHVLLLVKRI